MPSGMRQTSCSGLVWPADEKEWCRTFFAEGGHRLDGGVRQMSSPVRAVMIENGLDPADSANFAHVQWKVRYTLERLNKRRLVASDGAGHGVLWRIADQAA